MLDRNTVIKEIRTALKERTGKTWSVTGGRGTAWGWIKIDAPKARLDCQRVHAFTAASPDDCTTCGANRFRDGYGDCPEHECTDACYRAYMSKADRDDLAKALNIRDVHFQGVSIPSSSDHYAEYVARAKGLTPIRCGQQYWD